MSLFAIDRAKVEHYEIEAEDATEALRILFDGGVEPTHETKLGIEVKEI